MKLLVYKDHRLAGKSEVNVRDLKREEFIFYHEEFSLNQILMNHFRAFGFEPKILFKSSQWDLMSEMVAANLGITILPQSICNRVFNKDIMVLDLKPTILWNLAVLTKKDRYISNAARTFIEFILQDPL